MGVVKELIELVGDKPLNELTDTDGLDYVDWWRERVAAGDVIAGSEKKSMGMLSCMLKEISE